jgi:hypothetical protein
MTEDATIIIGVAGRNQTSFRLLFRTEDEDEDEHNNCSCDDRCA